MAIERRVEKLEDEIGGNNTMQVHILNLVDGEDEDEAVKKYRQENTVKKNDPFIVTISV